METETSSQKLRVLLIGTASIHVVNYASLVADDIELHVITNSPIDIPGTISSQTSSFSFRPFWTIPFRIAKLKKCISIVNPDLIHVHQANTCSLYALFSAKKIPVVVTAWGSDILVRSSNTVGKLALRFILKHGSAFTASCNYILDCMRKIDPMKGKPLAVANFGIEDDFPNVAKEKIIYSNRFLNPIYCIDRIIHEFARFSSTPDGNDWKLVIAGTGSEEHHLRELVISLSLVSKVEFTGWLTPHENRRWYARASFYVALPKSDSTSISLYEAMAARCIPIVSNLPANREVITKNLNGILVDEDSSGFFASATSFIGAKFLDSNRKLSLEKAGKLQNRRTFLNIYSCVKHG